MGTVPAPYTWVNGEIPDFREMEERLADTIGFMMNPPMVRLRKTNSQNFANNTDVAISWNFVEYESDNMWDASVPTRITPSTPGWYFGTMGGSFAANGTNLRRISVRKNGSGTETSARILIDAHAGAPNIFRGNTFLESFNGDTDYIELMQFQNSGGTLTNQFGTLEVEADVVLRWLAPL